MSLTQVKDLSFPNAHPLDTFQPIGEGFARIREETDPYALRALTLLARCKNLIKVYWDMKQGEEALYLRTNKRRKGDAELGVQKQRKILDPQHLDVEREERFVEVDIVQTSDEDPMSQEMQSLVEDFSRCKAS